MIKGVIRMKREDKIIRKLGTVIKISLILVVFTSGLALGYIGFNIAPNLEERHINMLILEYDQETTNWNNYTFEEVKGGHFVVLKFENLDPNRNYYLQWTVEDQDFDAWVLGSVKNISGETNMSQLLKVEKAHYLLMYDNITELIPVLSIVLYEEITTIDIIKSIPRLVNIDLFSMVIGLFIGLAIDLVYIMVGYKAKDKIMERIRLVRKTKDNS
jgi:hypothetical protein